MELSLRIDTPQPVMSRQAADIASRMSEFSCRILLRRKDTTVNAKSLMGLMSLGLSAGQQVTILANGEDAQEAVQTLARLLGADA